MNFFTIILIQPLANGLILFYRLLWGNMGLAIIAFSLFLRFVLNPLTRPYLESMKKIKEFNPQLEKLKKKYKNDRIKLAQAQADFYKEKNIKPGAGCLPYLLQIVVLIAFFNVFTRTFSSGGEITQNFNTLLYEPLKFQQDQQINTKFLYLNVAKPDLISLPGISFSLPGPILILAALSQLVSSKLMSNQTNIEQKVASKTKESEDDVQVAMQKSMVYTFPLFTLLIGRRFASGLALYWLVFSLTQVYQQIKIQGFDSVKTWFKGSKLLKS
jgi:YidC/Oxa1 family membrane protein insertase